MGKFKRNQSESQVTSVENQLTICTHSSQSYTTFILP